MLRATVSLVTLSTMLVLFGEITRFATGWINPWIILPETRTDFGQQQDAPDITLCSPVPSVTVPINAVSSCDSPMVTVKNELSCNKKRMHVVFLVPSSAHDLEWVHQEVNHILDVLANLQTLDVEAAAVFYKDRQVVQVVDFTNDMSKISRTLLRHRNRDVLLTGDMTPALQRALSLHESALDSAEIARHYIYQMLIVFASNKNTHSEAEDIRRRNLLAVQPIHEAGITLLAGCGVENGQERYCTSTRELVLSPRFYSDTTDRYKLSRVIREEADAFAAQPVVDQVTLEQRMPRLFEYVDGSANPAPSDVTRGITQTTLTWRWMGAEATAPQNITYRAQPVGEGVGAISGAVSLREIGGASSSVLIPSQPITVTGLCAPPTATPTDTPEPTPIPTITPIPTFTSTPTSTPSPTATPKPPLSPAYLPIALHEACAPERQRLAVALVLDASSSMGEPTSAGRSKLAAAQEAARAMLNALHLGDGDLAAVVTFNQSARLVQGLTSDRRALDAALGGIALAPQTCLVCGVDAAAAELLGGGRPASHLAVLVVLTDGRSNPQPASEAVARAAEAKARGVELYTVGIGEDVDDEALAAMASRPTGYYRTPDAEALGQVFAEIARLIPCPPSAFWGGR